MSGIFLDFENQVSILEEKLRELRTISIDGNINNVSAEILKTQQKIDKLLKNIYHNLTPWQKVAVARHPDRPKFLDYLNILFTDFIELSGDRVFGDDMAIVGGIARYNQIPCVVIGQEKGNDTESRLKHNFGMAKPEGYRKAYRLFELADKFSLPILTFVDTSGAYPGIESEERGQAEAIAKCMEKSFQIKVPFISVIIGEGGSGGAIALASSDYVLMLEHSIYSVISPEGCASILWKDDSKAEIAANSQKLTAQDLINLGIIDCVIAEPTGGAHRNKDETVKNVGETISQFLDKSLKVGSNEERRAQRRQRFIKIGDMYIEN
ncbi:MAG: acetyl-CoA carboxylase carboxyltransferase subunit alpha [Holosporales bacterium]|jgi:acetyl-CoA carboxylase carboxyl transferase subunit alpha|nr:acetyl-CoA carboxylase carboxyltransferase subunit alpha [Holosporales bacterium]